MWGATLTSVSAIVVGLILIYKSSIDVRVNTIISLIHNMESHGHEYWSNDSTYPNNKRLEVDIKRLSHRIGVEIQQLNKDCFGYNFGRDKFRLLTQFRQSITGGAFESVNRQSDETVVRNICVTCNMLIDQCRKSAKTFIIF